MSCCCTLDRSRGPTNITAMSATQACAANDGDTALAGTTSCVHLDPVTAVPIVNDPLGAGATTTG